MTGPDVVEVPVVMLTCRTCGWSVTVGRPDARRAAEEHRCPEAA